MQISYTRLLNFFQHFGKFYTRQFDALIKRTGLSIREIHILLFLINNPDSDTAKDITAFRGLSKSQVSQAVDLLAAEGLLERTPDRADRRVVHLSITPAGIPLAKEAQAIQSACGKHLLEGLSAEEKHQLEVMLNVILENGTRLNEEIRL